MYALPPTPEIHFLQVPLPDLENCRTEPSVCRFSVEGRGEFSKSDSTSNGKIASAMLHRDLGEFDEAIVASTVALESAFREGDRSNALRALQVHAISLTTLGDFRSAFHIVRQMRALAAGDKSGTLVARCDETEAKLYLRTAVQDWFAGALQLAESALDGYRNAGDRSGEARLCATVASALCGHGNYVGALERLDDGLRICAETQEWSSVNRLLLEAALALRDQGYRHNVEALFGLSMKWSHFVGDRVSEVRGQAGLAYLYDFEATLGNDAEMRKSESLFLASIENALAIGAVPLALEIRSELQHLYRKFGLDAEVERQQALGKQDSARISFSHIPDWLEYHQDYLRYVETHREDNNLLRLREAIEGIRDPFLIFDPIPGSDGSFEDLLNEFRNSAADELFGLTDSTVRTLSDLLSSNYMEGLRSPLMNAISERTAYEDEVPIEREGQTFWFTRRVVPAGRGAVLTLRDSTDSRNVGEALRAAAESARRNDRAKSEFLANMSHEVRTPINGVLGLARLLADTHLDEDQKEYVQGIISSGDVLLRVIGDVLDISKIEARSMEVNPQPTDPHALVADVVQLYRGQAAEKEIALRGMVEVEVPRSVLLDGPRVRQILGNLVGNAVKFTPSGFVHVALRREGAWLEFEVEDSGVGISEGQTEAVFEPFRQLGREASLEGGTGLGLTISKRFVELMGGRIGVASRPGEGSRFHFRLPLREAKGPESVPPAKITLDFSNARVLLVEDNEVNVLVARSQLRKLHCQVEVATNGAEALRKLSEGSFDLVLMDVRMPIMDGLAATRQIRSGGNSVPVVALTAGALQDERQECFEAGMDDYLGKPFTLESLATTLSRWVKSSSSHP